MLHRNSHASARPVLHDGASMSSTQRYPALEISEEAIGRRAYEKFQARGCVHGFDKEDWADAQRELMAEAAEVKN